MGDEGPRDPSLRSGQALPSGGSSPIPHPPSPPLKAVTFDYWDTLYDGSPRRERMRMRREVIGRLIAEVGGPALTRAELDRLYHESGAEAERWWRDEHRGYSAADRIRWLLRQLDIERPPDCAHVAAATEAVDEVLARHPAPLLAGAARMLRAVSPRVRRLAIVSDTGFASGRAQDRLLAADDLLGLFPVRVYSCDVGHAKPHPEPFRRALAALGLRPEEVLHVGDSERTDVGGALSAGLRAVRLDVVRRSGPSAAEFVAENFEELGEYLAEYAGG